MSEGLFDSDLPSEFEKKATRERNFKFFAFSEKLTLLRATIISSRRNCRVIRGTLLKGSYGSQLAKI